MSCVSSDKRIYGYSFFLDTGVLNVSVNIDSMFKSIATGTKIQDQYNDFRQKYYPLLFESDNAWFEKQRAERIHDKRKLDSLAKVIYDYDRAIKQIIIENVKQHPASLVSAYLVREYLTAYPDAEILEPLYNGFDSSIKNTYYGRQVFKSLQAAKRTMIGLQAPGFSIKDKDGKLISTHSLTGRFTLVDFWASWCGPCRAENPYLLKAFNQFHAKGLNIISVSMDDNRNAWLKAVDEDQLPWTQVSDLKGSKSPVKELYGIVSIPMNYLLDKEGKIIAKNLRGQELEKKLGELIK